MITLNLGLGEGDVDKLKFSSPVDLVEYIEELKGYYPNTVWLITGNGEYSEIMITESIDKIIVAIYHDHWEDVCLKKDSELHIHEYESYEDAYSVALSMKEGNPLCYNKLD